MPTLEQIGEALRRADAAGNSDDARRLAQAYVQMRDTRQFDNGAPNGQRLKLSQVNGQPQTMKLSQVQAQQPAAAPNAPIKVRGPDGATVEFPDGTPREEMERAMQAHYGPPGLKQQKYKITAPDGNSYMVTAPEGATQEQVLAYAQSNYHQAAAPQSLPTVTARPSAEDEAAAQPRSFGQDLGRAAIMTGRNVVQGVTGIPALLHDALVMTPYNAAAQALGSDSRINPGGEQIDSYMNALGVPNPQPENATERIVSAVDRGVAGAGGFIGAGKSFAGAAEPLLAGLGKSMASNAGNQIASTATGAASSEGAHEAGAGPWLQTAAGLLGGALPSAKQLAQVGFQGVFRGGETGRQRVAQNIADFEAAGTIPTVGQATQNARMQATSSQFIDSKLANIRTALGDDLDWNAIMGRGRTVPYQGMKELRSRIGEKLADIGFGIGDSSIARSDLRRLYAALSQDMKEAVSNIPEAKSALNRANAYHAAGMSRIEALSRVIDKNGGPEAVFNAATSGTRDGATTLRTVMQSLKPDERKVLASTIVRRLGKSTPGQQNAEGDQFSMSTFLTNWNKLSPQAKSTLFGRFGQGFSDDMDAVARMAANVRAGSKVFANPSGTATAGLQLGTAGAFIMSALTGHPGTAAIIAAGAGAANLSARLMTNPAFVRFLKRNIDVPYNGQIPNLANLYQMARGNADPDLKAAADLIQQAQQGER